MAGIYLHIPFCKQACYYCDFHFSTDTRIRKELVQAMDRELRLRSRYLAGEPVDTIYFGGGTPSLLEGSELGLLLETIADVYPVNPLPEITVEANPDDLTREKLRQLRAIGVNRLSIGIQSFDDNILRFLHRSHTAGAALESIALARDLDFDNISIDLIYAIPGLNSEHWTESLHKAAALKPDHISAYTLTIEEKTVFGRWMAKGTFKPVDETLAAEQQEILMGILPAAGYRQYEISNFALEGYESRHNTGYWRGDKYLGIGPAAHSYDGQSRQQNVANNHQYVRAIQAGQIPAVAETLKRSEQINEYILTTLRTADGCNLEVLRQHYSYDLLNDHGPYLARLQDQNLIILRPPHLALTETGKLLADTISADLFLTD